MKNTKWYQSIVRFFRIMKPMKWADRFDYIFSYYKELVFVVSIAALVISAVLFSALGDKKEVLFGGVFANTDISREGYDYLSDGVMQLLDGDPDTQKISLSSTFFEEVKELSQLDYAYNSAMKPIGMLEKGELDYMVMNETAMMFYMTQYALMDLREVFTESELAQLEEQLIYIELEKEQTRYPVAIDVSKMQFFVDCVDVSEPMYFSFTGDKTEAEIYRLFWDHLNAWQKQGT